MKEMKRGDMKKRFGWTDVLDPGGKPYLVQDNKGKFHILYWKAWFLPKSNQWSGSDWYSEVPKPKDRNTAPSARVCVVRVWQLPGVEYANPTCYSHQQHLGKTCQKSKQTTGRTKKTA